MTREAAQTGWSVYGVSHAHGSLSGTSGLESIFTSPKRRNWTYHTPQQRRCPWRRPFVQRSSNNFFLSFRVHLPLHKHPQSRFSSLKQPSAPINRCFSATPVPAPANRSSCICSGNEAGGRGKQHLCALFYLENLEIRASCGTHVPAGPSGIQRKA